MEPSVDRSQRSLHYSLFDGLFLGRWVWWIPVKPRLRYLSVSGFGSDADEATVGLWGGGQKARSCEAGGDASALVLVQLCTEPFMRTSSSVTDSPSVMIYVSGFHI